MTAHRTPNRRHDAGIRNQRGMALIMTILVLTTLIFIVLSLVNSVSMNRRMASDDVTRSKALHYAEAGVAEALARIQAGLGPDPSAANAAERVVQIVLAASPPAAGADTTVLATGQPSGTWMPYSSETTGAGALTIEFLTDAARTKLYRYDKTQNPPLQFSSGSPVYRITSTGTVGTVSRRLVVQCQMGQGGASPVVPAAYMANCPMIATGGSAVNGYDHDIGMPAGGSEASYRVGSGDAIGGWSSTTVSTSGGGSYEGAPPTAEDQTGFPAGPWILFGMSPSAYWAWLGTPHASIPPSPMSDVTYLDDDGVQQNKSGSYSFTGSHEGGGFLYVDGDLTLLAGSRWTGLIYVEGDCTVAAGAFVLGAVVVNGRTLARTSGSGTLCYCSEALRNIVPPSSAGGKPVVIAWQEQ